VLYCTLLLTSFFDSPQNDVLSRTENGFTDPNILLMGKGGETSTELVRWYGTAQNDKEGKTIVLYYCGPCDVPDGVSPIAAVDALQDANAKFIKLVSGGIMLLLDWGGIQVQNLLTTFNIMYSQIECCTIPTKPPTRPPNFKTRPPSKPPTKPPTKAPFQCSLQPSVTATLIPYVEHIVTFFLTSHEGSSERALRKRSPSVTSDCVKMMAKTTSVNTEK